jgi:hypothetical protein
MAFTNRTKISEYDATAANNINLGTAASPAARLGEYGVDADAEAMRPSDTNGALRELMAHLKAMDVGTNPLTTPNLGEPTADVIGLNTSYSEDGNEAQGSIFWNPDELTANLVQNGTILQIGQEIQINVRNSTGSDIADGSAVMATGTLGASGRITVGLMDASSAANAKMFIGIATETITAGGDGKVTWFGKVRDIDTSGFTQPSILWCDPATAGGLTETQPSAPNAKQAVAYVIYSATAQNGGTIFVRGTPGQLLSECHDVQISGTPADNEFLAYDTTTGAFINQTAAEAGVAALSGAAFTGDVSLDTRLLLADGTAASPAIGFTNDSDSGLYYSGGAVRVAFNGAQTFAFGGGIAYSDDLLPSATETSALGGTLNRWNTFYTKDGDFSGSVTLGSDSADTITVNGVLTNGAQINDGVGDVKIGYRNIPIVAATTVGATHVGKCLTASTTVTVPNSTMAAGDVVSIFNNSASGITLTLSPTLAYVNGADAASATLSAYGVATVLFIDSTTCVITGNVS